MKATEIIEAVPKLDAVFDVMLAASGLTVQDYLAVKAGARAPFCSHCGSEHLVGAGTGHRQHTAARNVWYCADRCRLAAMRARRRARGGAQ